MVVDGVRSANIYVLMAATRETLCSPNFVGKRRAGHGACGEYKHREGRGLGHHMRLGKAADDPPAMKGLCRASLLGLLAKFRGLKRGTRFFLSTWFTNDVGT